MDSGLCTTLPWRSRCVTVKLDEVSKGLHHTLPRSLRNPRHEETVWNRDREEIARSQSARKCTQTPRSRCQLYNRRVPITRSVPRGSPKTVTGVLGKTISAQQVNENHQNHNTNPFHDVRELYRRSRSRFEQYHRGGLKTAKLSSGKSDSAQQVNENHQKTIQAYLAAGLPTTKGTQHDLQHDRDGENLVDGLQLRIYHGFMRRLLHQLSLHNNNNNNLRPHPRELHLRNLHSFLLCLDHLQHLSSHNNGCNIHQQLHLDREGLLHSLHCGYLSLRRNWTVQHSELSLRHHELGLLELVVDDHRDVHNLKRKSSEASSSFSSSSSSQAEGRATGRRTPWALA